MILLPRASGTVNAPPLITVPAEAVTMGLTWQVEQPIFSNRPWPAWASGCRQNGIARRKFRLANELGEVIDIGEA